MAKLPPVIVVAEVIVPVALIKPAVKMLPPVTLAVADTCPPVRTLAPTMFAPALTSPAVRILPPATLAAEVMLPVADT